MKKTTNTKKEPRIDWLFGVNPNAIEQQEAQGQKELIASSQLPRICNSPRGINATEQYHKMGIKTFTSSKGDDLFIGVSLPARWQLKETDHSMWNNLMDDKGRKRAMIFYKAAFYDRDSFINFETRYFTKRQYFKEEVNQETGKEWDDAQTLSVIDGNTGEAIWTSEKHFYRDNEKYSQQAAGWLKENFPAWEDINKYWD